MVFYTKTREWHFFWQSKQTMFRMKSGYHLFIFHIYERTLALSQRIYFGEPFFLLLTNMVSADIHKRIYPRKYSEFIERKLSVEWWELATTTEWEEKKIEKSPEKKSNVVPVNIMQTHSQQHPNNDDNNNDGDIWLNTAIQCEYTVITMTEKYRSVHKLTHIDTHTPSMQCARILCTNNELLNVSIAQNKPFARELVECCKSIFFWVSHV